MLGILGRHLEMIATTDPPHHDAVVEENRPRVLAADLQRLTAGLRKDHNLRFDRHVERFEDRAQVPAGIFAGEANGTVLNMRVQRRYRIPDGPVTVVDCGVIARCDEYIETLATAVTGNLGGKVGVAPRLFLKKLVADLLDRIELHPDFDPAKDYRLTMRSEELTLEERNLTAAGSVEDISLDL